MPRQKKSSTTGYARIAQAEEYDDDDVSVDSETDDPFRSPAVLSSGPHYEAIQPKRSRRTPSVISPSLHSSPHRGRQRSNSGVDIKAINARLERWAEEIASKFRIRRVKGKTEDEEQLEIHHSVFQAPDGIRPVSREALAGSQDDISARLATRAQYEELVEGVRVAIENGVHPKLISQGSSGSYFARTSNGKVVGVFKPKDEEPYATRNPKWTKWIHRNLFPFAFGRACLIPNLSYISEAAASVLDTQLRTNLVPYTGIVSLSSKSFFYDFWDRRKYRRKRKALPEKLGSFQVFLKGFKDANIFLKEYPWPDHHGAQLRTETGGRRRKRRWAEECRPGGTLSDDEDDPSRPNSSGEAIRRQQFWSEGLKQSFREQLEKLVILDYIMRNTDRGLDNWMIKIDEEKEIASIQVEPPKLSLDGDLPSSLPHTDAEPYTRREETMAANKSTAPRGGKGGASITLGAIDNSLSWPWKHPDAWRSYPFGWLFLPVSLIGQPFSDATKQHFLPLLTSKHWWTETQLALRNCFSADSDFKERMFARQMAVMKGQAWNVVETLKTPDHGPLELTRRTRVFVWDDLVDVPVAMPMRSPSSDMREQRKHEAAAAAVQRTMSHDEMDISAAHGPPPLSSQHDLLGPTSPMSDLGGSNPFNISRQTEPSLATRASDESARHTLANSATLSMTRIATSDEALGSGERDAAGEARFATSLASSSQHRAAMKSSRAQRGRRRHFSFSALRSTPLLGYDDDGGEGDEGDIGYAAAEDLEQNTKKVIVERLETVKGKNPFFTWC